MQTHRTGLRHDVVVPLRLLYLVFCRIADLPDTGPTRVVLEERLSNVSQSASWNDVVPAMPRGVSRKVDKLATVRIGSARYSVPHTLSGQHVDMTTVDDRIEVLHQDALVAQHRLVPPGGTSILDEHYDRPASKPQRSVRRNAEPVRGLSHCEVD